jgi:hypothetical protein
MPQAQMEIPEEHSRADRPVADDLLLYVGTVHGDITDNAEAPHGEGDMRQDLLDMEASIMRLNITPAQEHPFKETEQHSSHLAEESAQRAASFSATGTTSFNFYEVLAELNKIPGKAGMTESNDLQVSTRKDAPSQAGSGKDNKNGKDADNFSMMAEGSQRSDTCHLVVKPDT